MKKVIKLSKKTEKRVMELAKHRRFKTPEALVVHLIRTEKKRQESELLANKTK